MAKRTVKRAKQSPDQINLITIEDEIGYETALVELALVDGIPDPEDAPNVRSLAASIDQVGLLEPVVLARKGDGRFDIIAGRRRLCASKMLEAEKIDSVVYEAADLTPAIMAGLTLTENSHRSDNPMVELRSIEALLKAGMTAKGIAHQLGRSTAWVQQRLNLRKLAAPLKAAVEDGRMAFSTAKEAVKLSKGEQSNLVETLKAKEKDAKAEGSKRRSKVTLDEVAAVRQRDPVDPALFQSTPDPLYVQVKAIDNAIAALIPQFHEESAARNHAQLARDEWDKVVYAVAPNPVVEAADHDEA